MAFHYDISRTDEVSQVRFIIGDTNSADPQMQDEEIQSFLDVGNSVDKTAVLCVRALVARYARYADKWIGDLKILASQRYRQYKDLLATLERRSMEAVGLPSAGGIYTADKEAYQANDALVQPGFRVGLHDNE